MKRNTLKIETVHQCNSCLGSKTLHPLVSVIDLSKANLTDHAFKFNFYTILMVENECDEFMYGRKYYDYSNATLLLLSPGQPLQLDENRPLPQKGWLLVFHPHLICGTTLNAHIDCYTFFDYRPEEALHLSLREKAKVTECLSRIEQELQHDIDRHSQTIISRYIELLLDYCTRFYQRQFITRCEANKELLTQLDILLEDYIHSGKLSTQALPTADYCADKLHLSPRYFIDLLHFETGKTIDLYFQLKRIEVAKKMLLDKSNTVNRVAAWLGYPSTQHFSRLFQKLTGTTPNDYRLTRN